MKIREMVRDDWEAVTEIYLEGIATGQATFEAVAPAWEHWNSSHLTFARLIATSESDGLTQGWAALSPVSARKVYAGVAEVSVYIARDSRGQGLGRQLLMALIRESEKNGIWTLQASIFPENRVSVVLHQNCGFRIVGVRERIGRMGANWRDTVLMERRSKLAGMD
jgi:phosphinothricin acetyltransferase